MIAGKGTPDQGPAHALKNSDKATFEGIIDLLTASTIEYLSMQIDAGAEVVKLFDSWAGSLQGDDFINYAIKPTQKIIAALKARHPNVPIIAFPRGAGERYVGLHAATGADCIAVDDGVTAEWAAANLQTGGCTQGNLKSSHMVTGGQDLIDEVRRIKAAFSNGPHIFNLGHGITPDADPENVQLMIDTLRES
jgi:uroporphyrinogen decarboxylase